MDGKAAAYRNEFEALLRRASDDEVKFRMDYSFDVDTDGDVVDYDTDYSFQGEDGNHYYVDSDLIWEYES